VLGQPLTPADYYDLVIQSSNLEHDFSSRFAFLLPSPRQVADRMDLPLSEAQDVSLNDEDVAAGDRLYYQAQGLCWIGVLVRTPRYLFDSGQWKKDPLEREYPAWALRTGSTVALTVLEGLTVVTVVEILKRIQHLATQGRVRVSALDLARTTAMFWCIAWLLEHQGPDQRLALSSNMRRLRRMFADRAPPQVMACPVRISEPPRLQTSFDQPQELLDLLSKMPLGADLHRHLIGTGPAELWASHAARCGQYVNPKDFQLREDESWVDFERVFAERDKVKTDVQFMRALIRYNVAHARQSRIAYLEMSVGPFLFLKDDLWEVTREECSRGEDRGVLIRFLIGLNRKRRFIGSGAVAYSWQEMLAPIEFMMFEQALEAGDERAGSIYQESQNAVLDRLAARGILDDPLVVGLDFCGMELGHHMGKQIHGLIALLEQAQGRLGMRIHAGEGIESSTYLIAALILSEPFLPKARLGHAVGLLKHLELQDYWPSSVVIERLRRSIAAGLVLEVNLSSNRYLLGIPFDEHPLRQFLRYDLPVVLGTDDPSVWAASELRNEFEIAIQNRLVENASQLTELVRRSITHSFLDAATQQRLLTQLGAPFQGP